MRRLDARWDITKKRLPDMRGWRAPRIVDWINENAKTHVATCEKWTVSTDTKIRGARLRSPGKGRAGYKVMIFDSGSAPKWPRNAVHVHYTAETYRRTEDLMNWVAENVPLKTRASQPPSV